MTEQSHLPHMKQSSVVTRTAFHFSSLSVVKQMHSVISLPFDALLKCQGCISCVWAGTLAIRMMQLVIYNYDNYNIDCGHSNIVSFHM